MLQIYFRTTFLWKDLSKFGSVLGFLENHVSGAALFLKKTCIFGLPVMEITYVSACLIISWRITCLGAASSFLTHVCSMAHPTHVDYIFRSRKIHQNGAARVLLMFFPLLHYASQPFVFLLQEKGKWILQVQGHKFRDSFLLDCNSTKIPLFSLNDLKNTKIPKLSKNIGK